MKGFSDLVETLLVFGC